MNQRALEAGARAILPQIITRDISDENNPEARRRVAAAVITAYEAYLKAEGFVVVPTVPTPAMIEAGDQVMYGRYGCSFETSPIYTAMVAASQEPSNASD
jgi:hypothetical protein